MLLLINGLEIILKISEKKLRFFFTTIARLKKSITFAASKTRWSVRLGVRTSGFHPGNRGSIPLRTTNNTLKFNNGKSQVIPQKDQSKRQEKAS